MMIQWCSARGPALVRHHKAYPIIISCPFVPRYPMHWMLAGKPPERKNVFITYSFAVILRMYPLQTSTTALVLLTLHRSSAAYLSSKCGSFHDDGRYLERQETSRCDH